MARVIGYAGYEVRLPTIVRAENCSLFDERGRRYVDLESGVWCTAIGHGHPRILAVMAEQAGRVMHAGFSFSSPVVQQAADSILSLVSMEGGACVFLCSGSEAVEYGMRVARMVTKRLRWLTMSDSYFGAYGSASAKREDEWYLFDWVSHCPDCPHAGDRCDEQCERWKEIPFDRIGGFLFEPGSSSGMVRFPPTRLIAAVVDRIHQNGGLIMVNEVTTGAGRTGRWFGYQHNNIHPDIVAMGKGIGNGYPVSVVALSPGVLRRLGSEPIRYAQSHQNDPLGAAVVQEVVAVITQEDLIARGRNISRILVAGLERLAAAYPCVHAVRARGLMCAIEFRETDSDVPVSLADRIQRRLLKRGFVVCSRPGMNVIRIDPALTIDVEDVKAFLEALNDVLAGEACHGDALH